ncbi:MAG: DNA-directed RNA polymerase subunit omega [Agathobacter sp.]|nr:DNA-directed RNA polymerase subunit omega [Agathobacter sp.]
MIHPSYVELMKVVNDGVEIGEEPVVNSRYSIVLATAKRARQLIDGAKPFESDGKCNKPLSIAVEELFQGDVKILTQEEENDSAAR